jgi:4-hydroxy-tetrahydrodipicolinate reductase
MAVPIVVMGAKGRMGTSIARMASFDDDFELAGLVERPELGCDPTEYSCVVGTDLRDVLKQTKNAVVINFTSPEGSLEAAEICAASGNPLVVGTTGLTPEDKAKLEDAARRTPIVFAPNMSTGINVLLKILPELVRALGDEYDMEMVELHHNQKKDAPSGTALRLAECLAEAKNWDLDEVGNYGRHGMVGERPSKEIGVQTVRGGDVFGVHTVYFMGPGERIEVTHQAHSRETFSAGALRAAAWLVDKKPGPLYTMADVLG